MVLSAPISSPRRAGALPWLALSAAVIVLDQLTKALVLAHLAPYSPQVVIDGVLNWTLAFNTGAAFSFLADAGGWQRWGFSGLAVVISAVLGVWLARTERRDWRTALPLALIVGGALGNLVDRLRFGHVVDFVQVYWWPGREFPAFNVADAAISVGAVLLAWSSLRAGAAPHGKTG